MMRTTPRQSDGSPVAAHHAVRSVRCLGDSPIPSLAQKYGRNYEQYRRENLKQLVRGQSRAITLFLDNIPALSGEERARLSKKLRLSEVDLVNLHDKAQDAYLRPDAPENRFLKESVDAKRTTYNEDNVGFRKLLAELLVSAYAYKSSETWRLIVISNSQGDVLAEGDPFNYLWRVMLKNVNYLESLIDSPST